MAQGIRHLDAHGPHGWPMAGPQAQSEAAGGELGHDLHLLGHHQRVARESGDDGCSELYPLGACSGGGKHGNAVQTGSAGGHPDGVDTQFFGSLNRCLYVLNFVSANRDSDTAHLLTSLYFLRL
jgi:hypothetical protein